MQQKALDEIQKIPLESRSLIQLLWMAEILRKKGHTQEAKEMYRVLSQQNSHPQIKEIALFFQTWEPK